MIQNIFKRMIDEIYIEYFKPNDWKKQGSNYRLFDDSGLGKIINFQKSKWNDVTTIEFYINYGVYMEAGDCIVNKSFKEYECQFRNRTKLFNGTYILNENTNYEKLKSEVTTALKETDTLFDKIANKQVFISMILSGTLQKETDTPIMHYYTCKLLSDMGYYEEIYEYVKACGGKYFDSLAEEIKIKMKN